MPADRIGGGGYLSMPFPNKCRHYRYTMVGILGICFCEEVEEAKKRCTRPKKKNPSAQHLSLPMGPPTLIVHAGCSITACTDLTGSTVTKNGSTKFQYKFAAREQMSSSQGSRVLRLPTQPLLISMYTIEATLLLVSVPFHIPETILGDQLNQEMCTGLKPRTQKSIQCPEVRC